jgi:uncharacterized metal-binding protein YceD (DUF177 family)
MAPEQATDAGAAPPFSRVIAPDEMRTALQGRIEANPAELGALAAFYRVSDIAALSLDYSLDPLPSGCYRLTGELKAKLTQPCVVTTEPVAETIREDISLEFWPENMLEKADLQSSADEILESDPPEPIVNGKIDLGHLVAELFASAINPYPRKKDVEFDWTDPKAEAGDSPTNPFAALAKLKDKK